MNESNTTQKFQVLLEDMESAARIAAELKQNSLASILYNLITVVSFAMRKRSNVDAALGTLQNMAGHACETVADLLGMKFHE